MTPHSLIGTAYHGARLRATTPELSLRDSLAWATIYYATKIDEKP